nr:HAD family hydrolase [Pseudonocardia sp. C8]
MAALLTVAAIAVQDPGRGDAIGVPWWSRRLPRSREPDGLRVAADRWCGLLVPAAVLLALAVTGFRAGAGQPWTAAVPAGLAVLLAACPVALLAAVPAGVRAADRAAGADVRLPLPVPAGTGWLDPVGWTDPAGGPRPADRVDTVALAGPDVLTGSGPGRVTVHAASGEDPAPVLRLAGSVAAAAAPGSALAPVARALAAAVPGGLPDVAEPDEQPGLGASGLVAELVTDTGRPQEGAGEAAARAGTTVVAHAVLVGSPCWLLEHGIRLPPGLAADRERAEAGGRAVVAVAWDGAARAVLALSRAPHPAVRSDVDALRAAGTEPVLLTPDGDAAARALGAAAGLDPDDPDAVRPGLGPACRAAAVAGLQVRGRTVAVAADPGTDEAALARADLAIELVPAPGPDGRPARIVVRGGPGTVAAAVGLARRGRVHARTGIVAATAVTVLGTAAAVAGAPAPLVALGPLLGAFAVRARRLRIRT